jgi:hypothetical protein
MLETICNGRPFGDAPGAVKPSITEGAFKNSQLAVRLALRHFGVWRALTTFCMGGAGGRSHLSLTEKHTTLTSSSEVEEHDLVSVSSGHRSRRDAEKDRRRREKHGSRYHRERQRSRSSSRSRTPAR